MKLLLTSSGITNQTLRTALEQLLGKPIAEASALIIPTAIYPFPGGARHAWSPIGGRSAPFMTGLGWKSIGILELSVLPSIDRDAWVPTVQDTDALLVWGGDPLFLSAWMRRSGLAKLLPSLRGVYVGTSAGSMVASSTFVETYTDPPRVQVQPLSSEEVVFEGDLHRTVITAPGVGLVEINIIAHYENPNHPDASGRNAAQWAAKSALPTYAIDDQSAVRVVDGAIDVVSEGRWKLFPPGAPRPA